MSTGPRLTHEQASAIARVVGDLWRFDRVLREMGPVWTVGSLRRGRETIGDIEFLCPAAPEPEDGAKVRDLVYELIAPTVAADAPPGALFETPKAPLGKPVKGFKPGFLSADFEVTVLGVTVHAQVFRYTPANRGWQLLMRTGPSEFNQWFLGQWKKAYGIEAGVASKEGHLVDRYGVVVPVDSEEECFEKARLRYVLPQQRESWRTS